MPHAIIRGKNGRQGVLAPTPASLRQGHRRGGYVGDHNASLKIAYDYGVALPLQAPRSQVNDKFINLSLHLSESRPTSPE
jgi:hypothetical protein